MTRSVPADCPEVGPQYKPVPDQLHHLQGPHAVYQLRAEPVRPAHLLQVQDGDLHLRGAQAGLLRQGVHAGLVCLLGGQAGQQDGHFSWQGYAPNLVEVFPQHLGSSTSTLFSSLFNLPNLLQVFILWAAE
jgi:hypothetical protein